MRKFAVILLLAGFFGCDEDEKKLPANLSVVTDVSTDGSGLVTVTATAVNAVRYKVFFGEQTFETPVETTSGVASHTYSSSGSYRITVRAYGSGEDFVHVTEMIDVEVDLKIPANGYTTPATYPGMTLVWSDEFNETSLNDDFWTHENGTGANGWGNNELQYYKPENTSIIDGHLVITARKESFGGSSYTSSRIITKDKKAFRYGRVDVRTVLPRGQGIWPAVWMLGQNITSEGWPKCGEIDIVEMIGGSGRENTIHGTVHWDNGGSHASYGGSYTLSSGIFGDEFHVFSVVWTGTTITWFLDDVQYHVIDITPAGLSEFQNEFFLICNLAVGGNWPGNPNDATRFPQYLIIDYIRVFQE